MVGHQRAHMARDDFLTDARIDRSRCESWQQAACQNDHQNRGGRRGRNPSPCEASKYGAPFFSTELKVRTFSNRRAQAAH
jgi:hypothetical protein